MSEVTEILKAGGMVPTNAKLDKGDAVDTVVARAYTHGVLPGRTIVRLTAQSVAAGDDLEMATLGFGAGQDRGAVGKERRRPLGFPGWALVNDPKNARFALDVVKEFKKHARKAKSKPGHAKDGIDAIALRLGKSVPHFLPSFYEEAGRAFIEHGATTFAAAFFGKAREAEAVHALEVDEEHRVHGFLEFALAGAVTTKALTQYAKDLGDHHDPKVSYAHFRQLCLQRTLGGMPPWSGMAKELRRLAKAAKLDPATEDAQFIAEIIESPALGKAAGEFWRAYAEPITALAKANPVARGALLNLFPTGSSTHSSELDDIWLDLLEASGATQALVGDDAPADARPSAGRAAWFDKLTQHLSRGYRASALSPRVFALLRRMAPSLIADAKPISCAGRYNRIDLDLCELALELEIPVAVPPERPRLDVEEWAKHATEPERGRDPVRAAAHPTVGPLVAASVANEIGGEPFDSMSRGKAGFLAAKRAWLDGTIAKLEQGGLPACVEAIGTINGKVKAETFAELPDLHARFAALDLAPALARTLRVGLHDEYGWPAFEEIAAELDPDGKTELTYHGGPPALILATKTRAIAVGPTGRLGEHDFVIPPKFELITTRFIGGEFLVVMKEGYKTRAYWSSAPHDIFESELSSYYLVKVVSRVAVFADGAWLEHETPMRPGERKLSLGTKVTAFDGTTAWISDPKDGQLRWREVTSTGELGRHSWPAFIEAGLEGDLKVDGASYVMPAPSGSSPLGVKDGLVGVRVHVETAPGQRLQIKRVIEMIDGTRWAGPVNVQMTCLVRMPGGGEPRPVMEETAWREGITTTILSPDGKIRGSRLNDKDRRYHRGQVTAITPAFWHFLVARDEAGSRRLHDVTDADARSLIAAVPVQKTTPPGIAVPAPTDVTGGVLPEVTHPKLRAGITGVTLIAAELELERDRLASERAPGQAAKTTATGGHNDDILMAGLKGFVDRYWSAEGRAWAQIERTGSVFGSEDRTDRTIKKLPGATLEWIHFALAPGSLAFIALAIGTPADKRKPIAELLQHVVTSLPPPTKLRGFEANRPKSTNPAADADDKLEAFELWWVSGNAYAVKKIGYQNDRIRVLEYAPDGVFKALPGWDIDAHTPGSRPFAPEQVAEVLAAIGDGKTSWSDDAAARLSEATGLTPSEGVYLWAGCPNAADRSANFLAKELRETLGLKAKQAEVARDSLIAIPIPQRIRIIDAAAGAGVAALLDGSAVTTLAAAWTQMLGARVAIPEELIAEADRELWAPMQPNFALRMIGRADTEPRLHVDGLWALDAACDVVRVASAAPLVGQTKLLGLPPVFDVPTLQTVLVYLPFVFAELPVGHSLRASAARAHELVLERLASPTLWFEAGSHYMTEEDAQAMDRVLDSLGGEMLTGFTEGITGRRLPGAVVQRNGQRAELKLHPASLDDKAIVTVGKLAQQITQWGLSAWRSIEIARSEGHAALAARIRETPVPEGRWEQNPLVAAPRLVDKVAKEHGVSKDAAALYLQYLALLWPTPKNVMMWNGWKPKQFETANRELLERDLVIEAKRERAQRTTFLPGGWDALKSPNPPMESWKLALYGTRSPEGAPVPPLVRFQALAPFHLLFERAWDRCVEGDVPRYEEVKR